MPVHTKPHLLLLACTLAVVPGCLAEGLPQASGSKASQSALGKAPSQGKAAVQNGLPTRDPGAMPSVAPNPTGAASPGIVPGAGTKPETWGDAQSQLLADQVADLLKIGLAARRAQAVVGGSGESLPQALRLVASGGGVIGNNGASLIGNNAAGILSNHGGSLISNNSGGLISNNSGGLISNNSGGLISNNSGGFAPLAGLYQLLQSSPVPADPFADLAEEASKVSLEPQAQEEKVASDSLPGGLSRLGFDRKAAPARQRDVFINAKGQVVEESLTTELNFGAQGEFIRGRTRRALYSTSTGQWRAHLDYREQHRPSPEGGILSLEHLPSVVKDDAASIDTQLERLNFDMGTQKGDFRFTHRALGLVEQGEFTKILRNGPDQSVLFDLLDPLSLHAGRSEVQLLDGKVAYRKEVQIKDQKQSLVLQLMGDMALQLERPSPATFDAQKLKNPPSWSGYFTWQGKQQGTAKLDLLPGGLLRCELKPDDRPAFVVEIQKAQP